eukprot:TRINITY_DN31119_c0_g1_i2.p2 TRINITY_DN31119_c0_g1~~TRINITY_DN31119_c0_g1_i2.p2  ORF type:complete len:103 (+),score=18.45 TRINITY_DN31119_c0_g1_i2:224-532(+)
MAAKGGLLVCCDFDAEATPPQHQPKATKFGENKENFDPASFQYRGGFTPNSSKGRVPLGELEIKRARVNPTTQTQNGTQSKQQARKSKQATGQQPSRGVMLR